MEILGKIEWGTVIFQIVILLVLLGLVSRFASRPILAMMQKRQDEIESQISSAEKNRKEAEQLLAEHKKLIKQSREEAHNMLERAKKQSEQEARDIVSEAKAQANQIVTDARNEIVREREKAVAELKAQVGELSVRLASIIIDKEIDAEQQTHIINKTLAEVGDRL